MQWGKVDPKWADEGRSGIVHANEFHVVFTVLRSNVNGATILVLDSDLTDFYHVGETITLSWDQHFWLYASEI